MRKIINLFKSGKAFSFMTNVLVYYAVLFLLSVSISFIVITPITCTVLLAGSVFIVLMGKEKIQIKYFVPMPKIQRITKGDWIDLRAGERVELKTGDYYLIRLGVGMILPKGYEALVLPRSSTPSKFGIVCANSMGVIDNSYSGDADEWKFPALAIRDTVIEKGDRIAQFRIVKNQPSFSLEIVKHLNEISRGGIGSTGKR